MATKTYDEALKGVLAWEGGYTNDPRDPGGPTNWGITIFDARAYWKPGATAADVKRMPLSVAKEIYRSKYWNKMWCDKLPAGVDYAVFDFGVNSGVSRSVKFLQRIIGAKADGWVGPDTLAAIEKYGDSVGLVKELCDRRLAFLMGLKTWPHFGRGWKRRVLGVKSVATRMAQEG